jgi:hypothetical protein
MQRTPITSKTGMTGIAYDQTSETLELSFVSRKAGEPDKVYHYTPFTAADWEAFQAAESKGSHFLRQIKPAFRCTKIEESHAENEKSKETRKPFNTKADGEEIPF